MPLSLLGTQCEPEEGAPVTQWKDGMACPACEEHVVGVYCSFLFIALAGLGCDPENWTLILLWLLL